MTKDKLRPLYKLLGEGNVSGATQLGDRLVDELEDEIASAKKQISLVREILSPYRSSLSNDGLTSEERGDRIRRAAIIVANRGLDIVTPIDVLGYLREEEKVELDVKRPASVVGTVLAKMKEFKRTDMGQYLYVAGPSADKEVMP